MTGFSAYCLSMLVAFAAPADPGRADGVKPGHKLVGTWKLVSAKWGGETKELGAEETRLKHVTPAHFLWVDYDKMGIVKSALGGTYSVDGDKYEETPEYGVGPIIKAFKGEVQKFTWKVEGNKWYHTGKLSGGPTIEEVWERVEAKAGAPGNPPLVGTWTQVSAKYGGREQKPRAGMTKFKHVTPTHFIWLSHDKDGVVYTSLGGPYTVTGDKYAETPECGVGWDLPFLKGKVQSFEWKVDGNKWYHTGKLSSGLTIEEVWERVEKK